MISPSVPGGVPRPAGSEYLYREVWAKQPSWATSRPDERCMWYVSVVRTLGGETVEAKPVHRSPMVATDIAHHTLTGGAYDVLEQVRPLLASDDGWKVRKVQPCRVRGCGNGAPMWIRERERAECASCAARTVVACVECGQPDIAHYANRERLIARQLCFGCDLWTDRVDKPSEVVSRDHIVYGIGKGTGPKSCKGFGGREWRITFDDGRVVDTDDLWCGGEVPEWFRDRIPSNAIVEDRDRIIEEEKHDG